MTATRLTRSTAETRPDSSQYHTPTFLILKGVRVEYWINFFMHHYGDTVWETITGLIPYPPTAIFIGKVSYKCGQVKYITGIT
jgi:hypothetical protein